MNAKIKSKERWIELIQAHKASGLRVEEFCLRENICRTSFYSWRRGLGMAKEHGARPPSPEHSNKNGMAERMSKGFMRVMPPVNKLTGICIETSNGYKVDTGYDGIDGLKDVLQVLRAL